jgi:sulfur relay (sulfurtransferase) DsrF/TusC family protein
MARHGHYPFFNTDEVIQSLKKANPLNLVEEKNLRLIVKKMKSYKTFERKKLFIQSLKLKDKELFIHHLYFQAHNIREKKHLKYN